jgi:hypothetical protein
MAIKSTPKRIPATTPARVPLRQRHRILLAALKAAETAIEEATDVLHSGEDGTPVTFLKPDEIEYVFLTLCGVIVQVHEAIALGESA